MAATRSSLLAYTSYTIPLRTLTSRQTKRVKVRTENLCVHERVKPGPDTLCARTRMNIISDGGTDRQPAGSSRQLHR